LEIPGGSIGRDGDRIRLIAAGLSIVILTAVNGIGTTLNGTFTSVNSSLNNPELARFLRPGRCANGLVGLFRLFFRWPACR